LRTKSAQAVRSRTQLRCSDLRPYEYFVCFGINGQSAVCNFRAIILFIRRIWAHDNTRRIMRISRGHRVAISLHRILLLSLCLGDRLRVSRPVVNSLVAYTSDPRVVALREDSGPEAKERNRDRRYNFHRFRFHRFTLRKISQRGTQTDVRGGKFKKDLRSCVAIRPAFSSLLSRYSFSKTRNLSSSISRSRPR